MEIIINTKNVLDDIGSKFLQELGSTDPIPPKGTLIQSLNEANARLFSFIGRYLESDYRESADNSLEIADNFEYRFLLSSRKAAGKSQPMADMIHSYLVNSVLTKSYTSMGLQELSTKHEAQTVSDATLINQLLHSKLPPSL